VTALVVLVFEPPDVACTDTLITQLLPAAIVPPLNVRLVSPAWGANVPPHVSDGFGGLATISPAGNVSVKPTPVRATVEFGLVRVNVRVAGWPTVTNEAPNDLVIVGGATTVIVAIASPPVPPLADVTLPLVLFWTPAVTPVTLTVTWHIPLGGMVPPLKLIVPLPATAVIVPPQLLLAPGVAATFSPDGRLSVNPIPVNATVVLGFVSVNDKVVVPFKATVAPPNALLIPGAWTMTTAAEFEALQPPALVTFRPSVTLPEAPAV